MVWKASILQACEAISFSEPQESRHSKGALRPLFFNNQRLVGREYKCAIHKVPSSPPLSGSFVCAHVVS
jgi:hypothetical protein